MYPYYHWILHGNSPQQSLNMIESTNYLFTISDRAGLPTVRERSTEGLPHPLIAPVSRPCAKDRPKVSLIPKEHPQSAGLPSSRLANMPLRTSANLEVLVQILFGRDSNGCSSLLDLKILQK